MNELKLKNVLHVPQFNHNLLSIHKLTLDNKCDVVFCTDKCVISDSNTKALKGVSEMRQGLYYLMNERIVTTGKAMNGVKAIAMAGESVTKEKDGKEYALWHQRLGHASLSKMKHIAQVKHCLGMHQ